MSVYLPKRVSNSFPALHKRDCILKKEGWVDVAQNPLVGFDNLLQLHLDEEIERVDVLFDQPFDLEKCGKKSPFVLFNIRLDHERPRANRLP